MKYYPLLSFFPLNFLICPSTLMVLVLWLTSINYTAPLQVRIGVKPSRATADTEAVSNIRCICSGFLNNVCTVYTLQIEPVAISSVTSVPRTKLPWGIWVTTTPRECASSASGNSTPLRRRQTERQVLLCVRGQDALVLEFSEV